MIDDPSEAQQILDELVADYGLVKMADRALARCLAEQLCSEMPNPSIIVQLRAALPPRPGAAASAADRPLARLDDEELALAESIACKLEGKTDPTRGLLRFSALRQRVRVLEEANEYMQAELRTARRKAAERAAGAPTGDSSPARPPEPFDNGLPGRHNVKLAVSNPQPKPIDEREAKLRAQRQASEDHAARLLGGLDGGGDYREFPASYERGDR